MRLKVLFSLNITSVEKLTYYALTYSYDEA